MRDDWRLGIMVLAAAAFAVAVTGCSTISRPKWTTAHPDTAAATSEPTAHPAAMVERAESLGTPSAFRGFVPRAELIDLRFRPGQVTISKADRQTLDAVVRWLNEHPKTAVLVEGHTDDLGDREANLAIGEKRALAIEKYLVEQGVDPARVTATTAGSDRPACDQKTDTCRAKNRRARFLVKP